MSRKTGYVAVTDIPRSVLHADMYRKHIWKSIRGKPMLCVQLKKHYMKRYEPRYYFWNYYPKHYRSGDL